MNDATSLSLIGRIQQQPTNELAWRQFCQIYDTFIERVLQAAGVSHADAEDIRQRVMVIIVKKLPTFEHSSNVGAFRKWLRTVTANELKGYMRGKREESLTDDYATQLSDPSSGTSVRFEQEHDQFVLQELIKIAAARHKPQTMDLFREYALLGRDAAKVAEEYGVNVNTVRIAKSKVMKSLRELATGLIEV